jgi:hypothetical protein
VQQLQAFSDVSAFAKEKKKEHNQYTTMFEASSRKYLGKKVFWISKRQKLSAIVVVLFIIVAPLSPAILIDSPNQSI